MINSISLRNLKQSKFILFFVVINLLFGIIIYFIKIYFNVDFHKSNEINIYKKFFYSVILAPFIETILFQYIPIEFLKYLKVKNKLIIIISGLIFGLMHYINEESIFEVVQVSIAGLTLSYAYLVTKEFRVENPVFIVALIHLLYNLVSFTINFFS